MQIPTVGAVYDRPQLPRLHSSKSWAVIDRPYSCSHDDCPAGPPVGAVYDRAQFVVTEPYLVSNRNIVRGHRPRLQGEGNHIHSANTPKMYISIIMMLIAVRHGETEWNVEHREIGQLDSPLTDRGVRQAEALGRRLSSLTIQHFYTSDLGRAVHTSEIISKHLPSLNVQLDAGLRERRMGEFEGMSWDEIRERYPAKEAEYQRNGFFEFVPGGESAQERVDRSVRTFTSIAEKHPNETVLAVTHAGILTGFLLYVLGIPFSNGQRFIKQNASFNAFEYANSLWRLHTWNDTSHLSGLK